MRPFRSVLLTLALLSAASTARAQVLGLPVVNSGVSTGVGIAVDVGFPNEDYGSGTGFGATGIFGVGPFGLTATVASFDPSAAGDNVTSYGGTLNLKMLGAPLAPISVTLQAGYAHWKIADAGFDHVPIGIGVAFRIPTPAFSVKPWIAPRIDILRGPGPDREDFGVSAGVELGLAGGLGVRFTYDWISRDSGAHPGIFGVGAQYVFRVPGL